MNAACPIDAAELLRVITGLQRDYACQASSGAVFERLLDALLEVTGSRMGFVGQVAEEDGGPVLATHAVSRVAWNDESRRWQAIHHPGGLVFRDPKSLLGEVLRTGKRLVRNDMAAGDRKGRVPSWHPELSTFAGIPLYLGERMVGMAGLADRPGGYDDALIDALEPLLSTAAQLVQGFEDRRQRDAVEGRLRSLVQSAPDAIVTVDQDGVVLDANTAALDIVGEDLDGWPLHRRLGLQRLPGHGERVSTTSQDQRARLLEIARGQPIPGENACSVVTIRDVTEREHIRTALQVSESRWQQAIAASTDGVWDWDLLTGYVYFSPRWMEMLGYGPTELPHHFDTFIGLVHPDDLGRVEALVQDHLAERTEQYTAEFRVKERSGRWHWVLARGRVVVFTDDGRPWRFMGTHVDIQAQREQAERLRLAMAAAESATRAKASFLANMSHEIRTPMNAILGTSHLLERTALGDDQRELLETIQTASQGLLAIVNDVLDLSKIESGHLDIEAVPFELADLLHSTRKTHSTVAQRKGLRLSVDLDDTLPHRVVGDPTRLLQVLHNLVGNALKFTEQGEVAVQIERLGGDGEVVRLGVSVEDTGIGIPEDSLAHIFQPFAQAEQSTTRRFGGTGLGLSICRRIVGMMGGQLRVESEAGVGSRFSFALTLRVDGQVPEVQDRSAVDGSELCGRVLLVEDNPVNRTLMERILRELTSCEVDAAVHGEQAVRMARNRDYDVILMDCQMPVMDGYSASRAIRSLDGPRGRVPIIAQTANAFSEDRQACLDVGMDDFITKPVDLRLLMQVLRRWLSACRGSARGAAG